MICNGTTAGHAERAAAGGEAVGTRFAAQEGKASSFKLWLKYAKPARGQILVDDGAARVLRESGSSLLPVGIVGGRGRLRRRRRGRGRSPAAIPIGKGITDYSVARAGPGARDEDATQVREVLPHAADEVIHRDRFVLL